MDWDWEDGPPRDVPSGPAPRGLPDRPGSRDPRQVGSTPPTPFVGDEPVPTEPRGRTPDERAAARARRRRQVRRRRLVAAAVAAVVVLVVVLALRGCGGSASDQAAATARPATAPVAFRTPTAEEPLRMAAYGESVGGGALLGIKLLTADRDDIKVRRFVKVASGLTRPDFFDWPAFLREDMEKRKRPFEAVALMFGANDGQDTVADGGQLDFGSGSWKAMYADRVGAVMDYYLEHGVQKVYWAGMPRMGAKGFNDRMELMNGIYESEAEKRAPRVEYIDTWTAVDAPAKTYQARYRQDDGVHLTVDGGIKAAAAVMASVAEDWRLAPFEAAR